MVNDVNTLVLYNCIHKAESKKKDFTVDSFLTTELRSSHMIYIQFRFIMNHSHVPIIFQYSIMAMNIHIPMHIIVHIKTRYLTIM